MKLFKLLSMIAIFLVPVFFIACSFFFDCGDDDESGYVMSTPATPSPNLCDSEYTPCDTGWMCDDIEKLTTEYDSDECIFEILGYTWYEAGIISCKLGTLLVELEEQIKKGADFDENPVIYKYYDYIYDPVVLDFYKEIAVMKIKKGIFSLPYFEVNPLRNLMGLAPVSFVFNDIYLPTGLWIHII